MQIGATCRYEEWTAQSNPKNGSCLADHRVRNQYAELVGPRRRFVGKTQRITERREKESKRKLDGIWGVGVGVKVNRALLKKGRLVWSLADLEISGQERQGKAGLDEFR